jgi:hypothetical protein
MNPLPSTKDTLLLRTDFSDERAWDALCAAVQAPEPETGFSACVTPLSDRAYDGAAVEDLLFVGSACYRSFLLVADRAALSGPDQPVLVVDLVREPGRTFRVIPSQAWSVENNLSLANMDFEEFSDAVDEDGVFRGFRDP